MSDLGEMPIAFGLKMIRKANEEKFVDRAWQLWLMLFPNWDKKHRIGFEEFLKKLGMKKDGSRAVKEVTQEEIDRFSDIADLVRHK